MKFNNFQSPSKIIDVLSKHKSPEQLLEKTDNIFSLTTLKSLTNSDSRKKSNKYLTLDIDPLVSSTVFLVPNKTCYSFGYSKSIWPYLYIIFSFMKFIFKF